MPRKQYLCEGELGALRLLDPTLDGLVLGLQALDRELDHLGLGGIMYFGEVANALHFSRDGGETSGPIQGLTMQLGNACVSNA